MSGSRIVVETWMRHSGCRFSCIYLEKVATFSDLRQEWWRDVESFVMVEH